MTMTNPNQLRDVLLFVCSKIIVLGSTTTTQKGSLVLHRLIRENWIKISSCVKLEDLLVDLLY